MRLFLFEILLLEVGWLETERYTTLLSVDREDDGLDLVTFAEAAKSQRDIRIFVVRKLDKSSSTYTECACRYVPQTCDIIR